MSGRVSDPDPSSRFRSVVPRCKTVFHVNTDNEASRFSGLRKRVNDSQTAGDSRKKEVQEQRVPGPYGRDSRVAASSELVKP